MMIAKKNFPCFDRFLPFIICFKIVWWIFFLFSFVFFKSNFWLRCRRQVKSRRPNSPCRGRPASTKTWTTARCSNWGPRSLKGSTASTPNRATTRASPSSRKPGGSLSSAPCRSGWPLCYTYHSAAKWTELIETVGMNGLTLCISVSSFLVSRLVFLNWCVTTRKWVAQLFLLGCGLVGNPLHHSFFQRYFKMYIFIENMLGIYFEWHTFQ